MTKNVKFQSRLENRKDGGKFKILPGIHDINFCGNSEWFLAVNFFHLGIPW